MPRPHLNPRSFPRIVIRFPTSVCDTRDTAEEVVVLLSFFKGGWLQPPARIAMAIKKKAADPSPFERQPVALLLHDFIVNTPGSSLAPTYICMSNTKWYASLLGSPEIWAKNTLPA